MTIRLIVIFLALAVPQFAQMRLTPAYGLPLTALTAGTQAQSSALSGGFSATWFDIDYYAQNNKTFSKIQVYLSAVNGTLGANDLVCDIYSDSAGKPNASLATTNTVTATPTTAGFVEFTGFSLAKTAGTQYHIIVRNANATPASNFPTIRYYAGGWPQVQGGNLNGSGASTSTNSGTTWTYAGAGGFALYRVQNSDNTYEGFPFVIENTPTTLSSSERTYSTHQFGASFTMGGTGQLNAVGCGFYMVQVGTPSANVECLLYSETGGTDTLLATSNSWAPANVDTSGKWVGFYFPSTIALSAGTKYRVVLAELSNADASSKYYAPYSLTIDSNANSLALAPMNGTLRGGVCNGTCTTAANWTDGVDLPLFSVLLDPTGETAGGTGGGTVGYAHAQ